MSESPQRWPDGEPAKYDPTLDPERFAVDAELRALRVIVEALDGLDPHTRARAMGYLVDRYMSEEGGSWAS